MEATNAEFEKRRSEYRKYLEGQGFYNRLEGALTRLYNEREKPDEAVLYMRQWLCETCPTEEQYEEMQQELKRSYKAVAELEQEVEYEKNNVVPTPEERTEELQKVYQKLQDDSEHMPSLLKKYLTPQIIENYANVDTKQQPLTRLYHCIRAGEKLPEDPIGVYAANSEAFTSFPDLFTPIVKDYHGKTDGKSNKALQPKADYGDVNVVKNLDPKKKIIKKTFISFSRNCIGFVLLPRIEYKNCMDFEKRMQKGLVGLDGEYEGTYVSLVDIDLSMRNEMADRKLLFRRNNPGLEQAGAYHYYPYGRGVFLNKKENFGVWVNGEDHLTVFSVEDNGNLGKIYKRVVEGSQKVEKLCKLKFYNHKSFGFITTSIANLGTGMQVEVDLRAPNLVKNADYFEELAQQIGVRIVKFPTGEEADKDAQVTVTVANKTSLGLTQIAIILNMQEAITTLLSTETKLGKEKK